MVVKQIFISVIIIVVVIILNGLIRNYIDRISLRDKIGKNKSILTKKTLSGIFFVLGLVAIAFTWGVDIENFWVVFTGIITVIAIGFFAVWSLLSNIIAGIILFLSKPFNIGDKIEIVQDSVKGKVDRITSIFTVVKKNNGNEYLIPNSLVFQRVIKKINTKSKK